jgi:ParB-like nuclease domain
MNSEPAAAPLALRWLPLDALKPDPKNARVHSDRQIARIADSIAAFGFNAPVLVDDKGGVLAGHGRLLAARRLGLKEVPTIALPHLDEAKRRAFMIADNRLAELASWDGARLGPELEGLGSLNLDFALSATGFELSEIDLRIKSVAAVPFPRKARRETGVLRRPMRGEGGRRSRPDEGATQVSAGPGKTRPVARAGDVWTLGPHRVACGDGDGAALLAIDAAIRRWEALAGEKARLDPMGKTFAAVERARRRASPSCIGQFRPELATGGADPLRTKPAHDPAVAPPPPAFGRSPSPIPLRSMGEDNDGAAAFLPRNAGVGDRAKHGGGGSPPKDLDWPGTRSERLEVSCKGGDAGDAQ